MTEYLVKRIATLLPTNRPAPMIPPMVIMVICRGFNERLRPGSAGGATVVWVRICGEDILYFFSPRVCLYDRTKRTTGPLP